MTVYHTDLSAQNVLFQDLNMATGLLLAIQTSSLSAPTSSLMSSSRPSSIPGISHSPGVTLSLLSSFHFLFLVFLHLLHIVCYIFVHYLSLTSHFPSECRLPDRIELGCLILCPIFIIRKEKELKKSEQINTRSVLLCSQRSVMVVDEHNFFLIYPSFHGKYAFLKFSFHLFIFL